MLEQRDFIARCQGDDGPLSVGLGTGLASASCARDLAFAVKGVDLQDGDAIESIWGVTVLKVNTLNRKGKVTRSRRSGKAGSKPDTKRAIVTLAAGDEIPLFEH